MKEILIKKLNHAFKIQWDKKYKTKFEISEFENKLGVETYKLNLNGSWSLIHAEKPLELLTEKDVDDLISRSLSNFLKVHPSWRRDNFK
tara:strand:+ start:118 stop:384 length:267 start_codon:yes stop_codon:yes gene_type:complete